MEYARTTIDLTLNLSWQSKALLQMLNDARMVSQHMWNTAAWYNGRERGVVLYANLSGSDAFEPAEEYKNLSQLNITFGEVRNTDQIFVDVWWTSHTMNPPTVNEYTDLAYKEREAFGDDNIWGAYRCIVEQLEKYG